MCPFKQGADVNEMQFEGKLLINTVALQKLRSLQFTHPVYRQEADGSQHCSYKFILETYLLNLKIFVDNVEMK